MLTPAHIDELVQLRASARLAAEDFSEAIKAAAEKHDVNKSALRKYISAKEKDQLDKLDSEADALASLLESSSQEAE
jgi:hypothetical protein